MEKSNGLAHLRLKSARHHGHGESQDEPDTKDRYWKNTFNHMGQELGVSGLRYAVGGDYPIIRRVIWTVLIVTGLGFMLYQIAESFNEYYEHPVTVSVSDIYPSSLRFPTLTICNENRFRRTKARALGLEAALDELYPPFSSQIYQSVINYTSIDIQLANAYSQHGFTSQEEFQKNMSNTAGELLFMCSFEGTNCNSTIFHQTWTDMGYCLQFNPASENRQAKRAGSYYGLVISLDVAQDEYISQTDYAAGFRIYAGEPDDHPHMVTRGTRVGPRSVTNVEIFQKETTLLEAPYGTCIKTGSLRRFSKYTVDNCKNECLLDFIYQECNCLPVGSADALLNGEAACTLTAITCMLPAFTRYQMLNLGDQCQCREPCESTTYSLSSSWNALAERTLVYISQNLTNGSYTTTRVDNNFVTMSIHFPVLSYTKLETQIGYTTTMLFNDLGGALGLMLGSTFLTIYEVFDIIIWAGIVRCKQKKKVQNVNQYKSDEKVSLPQNAGVTLVQM